MERVQSQGENMKYLSTSQFARLCRTSKDTLLFYDREGLLRPRRVSEKGYRRYGAEQFYEFDMIRMFRDVGISLKDIRSYMREPDPCDLLRHLEEKRRLLRQERMRLLSRQRMLEANMALAREAMHARYDVPELVAMDAERLSVMPVSPEEQATDEGSIALFAALVERFEGRGQAAPTPLGFLLRKEHAAAASHVAEYFFCGASRETGGMSLHVRPAGLYARLYHRGDFESHKAACEKMADAVARQGWEASGHLYGYDMASYIVCPSTREYVTRYCVRVAADSGSDSM